MNEEILLKVKTELTDFILYSGPKLIYAIIAFLIGIVVINILRRILRAILSKSKVEL